VPPYNFAKVPLVHEYDDFWHRKYGEDAEGRLVKREGADQVADQEPLSEEEAAKIHMPSPSYFPMVASFGLPIMAYGMVYGRDAGQNYLVTVLGAIVLLVGLFAWALEPATEPHDEHDDHGHSGNGPGELAAPGDLAEALASGTAEPPRGEPLATEEGSS
jgi:cytochrome c oxidase subunit 1